MRTLSIVIPALNEERNIALTLESLIPACRRELDGFELILINDGSTDGTGQAMRDLARRHPEIVVVHHDRRQGVGASYRDGIDRAKMEYVTLLPSDNVCDGAMFGPYFRAIGSADLVLAYRENQTNFRPRLRAALSVLYTKLCCLLLGLRVKDIHAMAIYPTPVVRAMKLKSRGYMYSLEFLVPLLKSGWTFVEVPHISLPEDSRSSHSLRWGTLRDVIKMLSWLLWTRPWKKLPPR